MTQGTRYEYHLTEEDAVALGAAEAHLQSWGLRAPLHPGQFCSLHTPSSHVEETAVGFQHLFPPMFHPSLLFFHCYIKKQIDQY